jgi:glyoxylase-like metal-dependent hydrolase (beta-lactamase superfamily II)
MYTEYADGITAIDCHYTRPRLAACYLLEQGGEAALIETGTRHSVPAVLDLLEARGIGREGLRYVIPTHVHLDHAGGAGVIMQACPRATLIAHPRGARHLIDPSKLSAAAEAVYGAETFRELYGSIEPVPAERVVEAPDGYRLDFNGRELLFRDAPGHARHHFCVWDAKSRGWFTGDNFGIGYPELETPGGRFLFPTTTPTQFEPERLKETMRMLFAEPARRFFLTHFGAVDRQPDQLESLYELLDAYIRIGDEAFAAGESEQELATRLTDYTVQRLHVLGCRGSEAEWREVLALDMGLNAQGILHRLQSQAAA